MSSTRFLNTADALLPLFFLIDGPSERQSHRTVGSMPILAPIKFLQRDYGILYRLLLAATKTSCPLPIASHGFGSGTPDVVLQLYRVCLYLPYLLRLTVVQYSFPPPARHPAADPAIANASRLYDACVHYTRRKFVDYCG